MIIQDLDGEGVFAVLVRCVVELEVVVTHTQETEVIIPDIRHISLGLSQWNAKDNICSGSSLYQQPVSSALGIELIICTTPSTDDGRICKVSCSEVGRCPKEVSQVVDWTAGKGVEGFISVVQEKTRLHPGNVSSIIVDEDQGRITGIPIPMTIEHTIAGVHELPASLFSVHDCAWPAQEVVPERVESKGCLEVRPLIG